MRTRIPSIGRHESIPRLDARQARAEVQVRRQGRHRGRGRRDPRRPSAAGTIGGESTADLLRQARYDKAIKAVVLRVDSPGGSMFASEQILREVQNLRKAGKPVVVSMSTYAASGGYYISAAANEIFASPTTLTGSIGVFSVVPTFERTSRSSASRSTASARRPLPAACASIGARCADGADAAEFGRSCLRGIPAARGRGAQEERRGRRQDRAGPRLGRRDAERIGLVDHLGGLKDATDAAAKLADLSGDYGVDYIESELTLREQLLLQLRSEAGTRARRPDSSRRERDRARARSHPRAGARDRAAQRSARAVRLLLVQPAELELQSAAQSKMILPDFPEFMISKPSR
jgi:ClpP class serine protease